jgi:hypothetical protein
MEKLKLLLSNDGIFYSELYSSDYIEGIPSDIIPNNVKSLIYFLHNVSSQFIEL